MVMNVLKNGNYVNSSFVRMFGLEINQLASLLKQSDRSRNDSDSDDDDQVFTNK
jgi:hypothetical protein